MLDHPDIQRIAKASWKLAEAIVPLLCRGVQACARLKMSFSTALAGSSRTLEVARLLVERAGSSPGSGVIEIHESVRTIAEWLECSPGTAQYHLRRCEHAGIKVGSNPLLIDTDALAVFGRAELRLVPSPASAKPAPVTTFPQFRAPKRVTAGVEQQPDPGLEAAFGVLRDLGVSALERGDDLGAVVKTISDEMSSLLNASSTVREEMRDGNRAVREPRDASDSRGQGSSFSRTTRKKETSFLSRDKEVREEVSRGENSRDHKTQRREGPHRRDRSELEDLLTPLLEMCKEKGLPGVESWRGLSDAMSVMTDDQVAHAGRALARDMKGRSDIRKPIGYLIQQSHQEPADDDRFFPASPPPLVDHEVISEGFNLDLDDRRRWRIQARLVADGLSPETVASFDDFTGLAKMFDLNERQLATIRTSPFDLTRLAAVSAYRSDDRFVRSGVPSEAADVDVSESTDAAGAISEARNQLTRARNKTAP